ncbi:hypothetical protein B0H11DRAFT_490310 [Mycena galericulata]|nr:hypothetical protein B0H11DRAFT_490310 [Mycena galericulata]
MRAGNFLRRDVLFGVNGVGECFSQETLFTLTMLGQRHAILYAHIDGPRAIHCDEHDCGRIDRFPIFPRISLTMYSIFLLLSICGPNVAALGHSFHVFKPDQSRPERLPRRKYSPISEFPRYLFALASTPSFHRAQELCTPHDTTSYACRNLGHHVNEPRVGMSTSSGLWLHPPEVTSSGTVRIISGRVHAIAKFKAQVGAVFNPGGQRGSRS